MMEKRIQTYGEFWPFYLSQHLHPWTKRLHVMGTLGVFALLGWGLYSHHLFVLWFLGFVGYGPAWFSHFYIEKNKPATFQYPWWSFISDFRMTFLYLSRKL